MRGLLGTLREVERTRPGSAEADRAPQPTLADLPALVESFATPNRTTAFDLVESQPGAAQPCRPPSAHSIHRTVQEALTNVEKHSTAARVSVVLRLETGDRRLRRGRGRR